MRQFAVTLLLALGFVTTAGAQSLLNELREKKPGQGAVTVIQSPEIDELVNNAKLAVSSAPKAPVTHPKEKPETERKTVAKTETESKSPAESTVRERTNTTEHAAETTSPTVNTSKKVMRNARRVTGYRVQAYSGGNSRADRQKAESIGNAIKLRFPDMPVYVHFYSPRWICRVGNFRTYDEANEVLKEIKSMGYRQACIVKGKITVAY